MSGMIKEVAISVEGRGRESQLPYQGGKKGRGASKVRSDDLATLSIKVSALEEAMLEMTNRVEKVEGDLNTLKTYTLD